MDSKNSFIMLFDFKAKLLIVFEINNEPNIQNGRGSFTLKNFELKIPPKLLNDETIAIFIQNLGVRNGLIRVRQLDFTIHFYDNEFGHINASFISPFLKMNLNSQMSIDSKRSIYESIDLFDTELRINPISYGVRDMIRECPIIVLKFSGPLKNPTIIGID